MPAPRITRAPVHTLEVKRFLIEFETEAVETAVVGEVERQLRILATSREPLAVDGETVWRLDPV